MKTFVALIAISVLMSACGEQSPPLPPVLHFCPKPDITAYELALLIPAIYSDDGSHQFLDRALRLAPASNRHISQEPCP